MKNVIISGFSGCLKSSFMNKYGSKFISKGYKYFDSDSKIMEKCYDLFSPKEFNKIPRTLFRLYLMEQFKENTVFNRSIIDNLAFSELSRQGKLEVTIDEQASNFNYKYIDKFAQYENDYPANRYLIINNDENIIKDILSAPNFKYSSRWDIYETIDQYLDLQNEFIKIYKSLINNYTVITLNSNMNYDEKLQMMNNIIGVP